ncbi:MAG: hypothetical protein E4H13_08465 [Calditrichales bacterium]|nr:MAG: hypothetical protein E4H13_08465 [Calditrichales bacterium]
MPDTKKQICPVFPDLLCPRGEEASEACKVRLRGDFDPIQDFRDQLLLECAIFRSQQAENRIAPAKKDQQ